MMLQSISKIKIYFYLFLFVLLSTFLNLNFITKFEKSTLITDINISGLNTEEKNLLKKNLKVFINKNIFLINKNEVEKININNFYQWLNIDDLNFELNKTLNRQQDKSNIVELFTEPIKTEQICKLFNIKTNYNKNFNKKVVYNYKPEAGYYKKKTVVLKEIKMFIKDKR